MWEASAAERDRLERLAGELIDRGRREGTLRADLAVADIGMVMCSLASSIGRGFDWRRHLQLDARRAARSDRGVAGRGFRAPSQARRDA